MFISIILFILSLLALIIVRRNSKFTKAGLLLEIVLTATLSYLAALVVWLLYNQFLPESNAATLIIWILMFVCFVISVRMLGNRYSQLSSGSPFDISIFVDNLSYHASVFWKLLLVIAAGTLLISGTIPSTFILIFLSYAIVVSMIIESSVKMFHLQPE